MKKINSEKDNGFSDFEKGAMKERAKELKLAKNKEANEQAVLEKIEELIPEDRIIVSAIFALVKESFPALGCRTWYGMPAWTKDDKVFFFFQGSEKFGSRYCTLGFSDLAKLDNGAFWPTSYAITEWNEGLAQEVESLIAKAMG